MDQHISTLKIFNHPHSKVFSLLRSNYDQHADIFVPTKRTFREHLFDSHHLDSKCALEVTEEQDKIIDQIYKEKQEIDTMSGIKPKKMAHLRRVSHIYYNLELKDFIGRMFRAKVFSKIEALLLSKTYECELSLW